MMRDTRLRLRPMAVASSVCRKRAGLGAYQSPHDAEHADAQIAEG